MSLDFDSLEKRKEFCLNMLVERIVAEGVVSKPRNSIYKFGLANKPFFANKLLKKETEELFYIKSHIQCKEKIQFFY